MSGGVLEVPERKHPLLGREETHTEVLVLDQKRPSLRLSGRSVQRGSGPRLYSPTKVMFRSAEKPILRI